MSRLTAEDRFEIYELYARYAHCYDFGRADELAALFTADGSFVRPGLDRLQGREAIREYVAERTAAAPGCIHQTGNIYLEGREDGSVRGHAYAVVMRLAPGDVLRCRNLGFYDDEIVSTDGGWRFARRDYGSWADSTTVDAPFAFEGPPITGVALPDLQPSTTGENDRWH
jgi:uncharacterized protein (TIGR02246 family)